MKKKYLLVTAQDEPNIAVIKIKERVFGELAARVPTGFQKRLIKALDEHFGTGVNIGGFKVISSYSPIRIEVVAIYKQGEFSDEVLTIIHLNETWMY